jgi:hypothetical protein
MSSIQPRRDQKRGIVRAERRCAMKKAKGTKVKDLKVKEEKAKQVKGGFNPQPEPPGKWKQTNTNVVNPVVNNQQTFR